MGVKWVGERKSPLLERLSGAPVLVILPHRPVHHVVLPRSLNLRSGFELLITSTGNHLLFELVLLLGFHWMMLFAPVYGKRASTAQFNRILELGSPVDVVVLQLDIHI
jgi:hypothetical protein